MNNNLLKGVLAATVVVLALVLAFLAYDRPGYFTSQATLGGILFLEFMAAAVWAYRKAFFPFVILCFLMAGVDLPVGSGWTVARWIVLGTGAMVGLVLMLKERRDAFGMFHVVALFAVLAALVSAAVSRFTTVSFLKVLSLMLLFLYAATGARLAVVGRENRFFAGLLTGCEVFVALIAAFYVLGREVMGNPNSLGAVMGVVAAPILLWGTLLKQEPFTRRRRLFLYTIAMYLTVSSHARAAILAASVSSALLCLALRRYKLFAQGIGIVAVVVAATAIIQPEVFTSTFSSLVSTVVYKGKDPTEGLLSSRRSPWQDAMEAISSHFWFGTGFGTSDTGQDATENLARFSTTSAASTEHGSSYLAITEWVGIMGVLPFLLLLASLASRVVQVLIWMYRSGNPSHAAVPLAIVILAGMMHAGFEDWLFAPGYYLCVFYWSMAFVFVDQVMTLSVPDSRSIFLWRAGAVRTDLGAVAPSR